MDRGIKTFKGLGIFTAATLLSMAGIFAFILNSGILDRYRELLLAVIFAALAALVLETAASLAVLSAIRGGKAAKHCRLLLRIALSVLLPIFLYLAGLFRKEKDYLRRLYISLNNSVSSAKLGSMNGEKLLVLLPHCMQNKDCICRITEDIKNCRRCGGCKIGEIAGVTEQYAIKTAVAKGGTAARNIVKESKPGYILAVACERDLVSGIADVGRIPVIGIINQRPNGYCNNTTLDMAEFKHTLQLLLESREEESHAQLEIRNAKPNIP